ncbi:MAG TPA: hypothetical protein PLE10_01145 [Brevefilum sp.]|nr:hypothetical protein [Brevefilum sp.]
MTEKEYLPFKTINVFFERNYLDKVIKEILEGVNTLSREEQTEFVNFFRKHIKILGFRNPVRAPLSLKINAYASAFEEKEDVIPYTLTTWAKIKSVLANRVQTWLVSEGWEELTLERRYGVAEGFNANWPKNLTFDEIEEKFKQAHPKEDHQRDDFILMVLWISGTLPKE